MLPPVTKTPQGDYRPLDGRLGLSIVRRARSAVLLDVVERWKPDVLLVDHSPHGMQGELLPVFDYIRSTGLATRLVLGLRDILDEPEKVIESWTAEGVYSTLENVYNSVMVYGQRDVFDIATLYRLPSQIADRLVYCGYVTTPQPMTVPLPADIPIPKRFVFAMIGGGGDGVQVLIDTALAATTAGVACVLCTGPLMPRADRERLERATAQLGEVYTVEHLAEPAAVAAKAVAVVTRGGYNSLCELIGLGVPTIVVPRRAPRIEQVLRAAALAKRGLVALVEESRGLHSTLPKILSGQTAKRSRDPLDLGGAQQAVAHLSRLANRKDDTVLARIPA
jgi:predicted glycosyltransferase